VTELMGVADEADDHIADLIALVEGMLAETGGTLTQDEEAAADQTLGR